MQLRSTRTSIRNELTVITDMEANWSEMEVIDSGNWADLVEIWADGGGMSVA
ncbi:hypothetical protein Hanom_Chr08g00684741 [Helianthus anomalus]